MIYHYPTLLTTADFIHAFNNIDFKKGELELLKALYDAPNHKATGIELQQLLQVDNNGGINLTFARIAKKITTLTKVYPSGKRKSGAYRWWSLLAIGTKVGANFAWQLKPEVVKAIEKTKLLTKITYTLAEIFPLISQIIREKNLSQEWVDRDKIAAALYDNPFIQEKYLTHVADARWTAGNMVDWFSKQYTKQDALIRPYLAEFDRKKVTQANLKGTKRPIWAYRIKNVTLPDEMVEETVQENNLTYREGRVMKVIVNRYERDSKARLACIVHYGHRCQVCEFDFAEKFGSIGEGFIHVHHLKEISTIGEAYEVNPIEDLRPVCPNCHAMLHKRVPAYTIAELKGILNIPNRK